MKSPVTIDSTATITVPQKHWPKVRAALAIYHRERIKNYAEYFITHTDHCNLLEVGWLPEIKSSGPRRTFWLRVRLEMPMNFKGELIFQIEPQS